MFLLNVLYGRVYRPLTISYKRVFLGFYDSFCMVLGPTGHSKEYDDSVFRPMFHSFSRTTTQDNPLLPVNHQSKKVRRSSTSRCCACRSSCGVRQAFSIRTPRHSETLNLQLEACECLLSAFHRRHDLESTCRSIPEPQNAEAPTGSQGIEHRNKPREVTF